MSNTDQRTPCADNFGAEPKHQPITPINSEGYQTFLETERRDTIGCIRTLARLYRTTDRGYHIVRGELEAERKTKEQLVGELMQANAHATFYKKTADVEAEANRVLLKRISHLEAQLTKARNKANKPKKATK